MKNVSLYSRRGAGSLVVVLLLGSIVLEVGIVGALLAGYLSNTNLGTRLSLEAFSAAHSGIDDAFMRILRNDYAGCTTNCDYELPAGMLGEAVVAVHISCMPNSCTSGDSPVITAAGTARGRRRTLEAVIEIDPLTKVATVQSLKEI